MTNQISVSHPTGIIKGKIYLKGSKSIANRALIIRALCDKECTLSNLPEGDDTNVLLDSLSNQERINHNVKLAGTSSRFLTAFFATRKGIQIIDAEEGLKKRPIKPLVDVLRQLGCVIEYQEEEGRFPIKIYEFEKQTNVEVSVQGNFSSQFITALLLISPTMPLGLTITVSGHLVSKSYIEMTISMMKYFGVEVLNENNRFTVLPQKYQAKNLFIEGDWSSGSYFFGVAALAKEAEISLTGLMEKSWQGDASILDISKSFGVEATFVDGELRIIKKKDFKNKPIIELDFVDFPDLFQTVAVMSAALSKQGVFTGLDTLPHKETNRLLAVQNELMKCGNFLNKMPERFSNKNEKTIFILEGNYKHPDPDVVFETYDDHRMAMSLAQLALLDPVMINNPEVVQKSYPRFWEDMKSLGFQVVYLYH